MNSSTLLATTTLILSTLMAITSSNWLSVWVSMELNLLSFVPILMTSKTYLEAEGATKYFLSQALGSSLLLFSAYASYIYSLMVIPLMLTIALLMKLGSFPCHFWFPPVMQSINWVACLLLSTWQKIAPLSILMFFLTSKTSWFFIVVAMMNAVIGGVMGVNQSQLRAIMAYSSINHMGWMLSLLSINNQIACALYFFIYSSLVIPIFILFNKLSSQSTKSLNKLNNAPYSYKITIIILLLALGGLPPMNGFLAKLMVLFYLTPVWLLSSILMVIGSIITLYFYLNICMALILNLHKSDSLNLAPVSSMLLLTSSLILLPLYLMSYAMTLFYKS